MLDVEVYFNLKSSYGLQRNYIYADLTNTAIQVNLKLIVRYICNWISLLLIFKTDFVSK